jgi:hypothetical protein
LLKNIADGSVLIGMDNLYFTIDPFFNAMQKRIVVGVFFRQRIAVNYTDVIGILYGNLGGYRAGSPARKPNDCAPHRPISKLSHTVSSGNSTLKERWLRRSRK